MTLRFDVVCVSIGGKALMFPMQRMVLMRASEYEMEGIYVKVRRMRRGPS